MPEVKISLIVDDRGTLRILDDAGKQLEKITTGGRHQLGEFGAASQQLDKSMRQASGGVRALVYPLTAELSPALGTTVSRMAGVVSSAALMPGALAAAGVAAAGLAGIVLGKLAASWGEARERMEDFRQAMTSLPFEGVQSEITKSVAAMQKLNREIDELTRRSNTPELRNLRFSLMGLLGLGGNFLTFDLSPEQREAQRRLQEEANRNLQRRVRGELLRGAELLASSDIAPRQPDVPTEAEAKRFFELERTQRGLFDFRLDPIEASYQQALRQASDLRLDKQPEAASRLEAAAAEIRRLALTESRFSSLFGGRAALEAPFAADVGAGGPLTAEQAAAARASAEEQRRLDLELRFGAQARAEAGFATDVGAGGPLPAAAERAARDARRESLAITRELAAVELQRLAVFERTPGLTRDERDNLDLVLSAERERLQVAELRAQLETEQDPRRKAVLQQRLDLVATEEAMTRAATNRARFEREDVAGGMLHALDELEREWGHVGDRMAAGMLDSFRTVQRGFSDIVVAGITGELKTLPEIGQRMGRALLTSLVDEFTKFSFGPMVTQFRAAFGGGRMPVLVAGTAGAGGIARGAEMFAPAAAAGDTVLTVVNGHLVSLPASSVEAAAVLGAGAGGGGLPNIPFPSLSTFTGGGGPFAEFLGSPLFQQSATAVYPAAGVLTAGGVDIATEAAALGIGGGYGGAASTGAVTVGQALGGAAAAIGLGLTVYTALQGPPTAQNIVFSAASGALTGAAFGSLFGPAGTAVGAIAGALLGGGAAAFGKGGRKTRAQRRASEISRGTAQAQSFLSSVQSAQSIEELNETLAAYSGAQYGGVTSGFPIVSYIVLPDGTLKYMARAAIQRPDKASIDELVLYGPDTYHAIIFGIDDPGAQQGLNTQMTDAVKQKLEELVQRESSVPFGFTEETRGLTRTTYLPFRALDQARGQADVFVSRQLLREDLGLDDDYIEQLFARIRAVVLDRNLVRDVSREDFLAEGA